MEIIFDICIITGFMQQGTISEVVYKRFKVRFLDLTTTLTS